MKGRIYKFENFKDKNFPVYSSYQSGREDLVVSHFHESAEFIKVVCGEVDVYIESEKIACREGDVIYISPLVLHGVRAKSEDAAIRGFVFGPEIFGQSVDINEYKKSYFHFNLKEGAHSEINSIMDDAFRDYDSPDDETYVLKTVSNMLRAVCVLIKCDVLRNENDIKNHRTKPVLEYIKNNYQENIKIASMAAMLNLCEDHFIRVFKQENLKTPAEYLLDFRLNEAMKLLSVGDETVSQVAEHTGFGTAGYFIKAFKKKVSLTPNEYKKSLKKLGK